MAKNKAILIKTDGYEIWHKFYESYEDAKSAMDEQYEEATPEEWDEDSEEISECGSHYAALYRNGEDVFIWRIVMIPSEKEAE